MSLMVPDDATDMSRARMSVVWAEPPFECPSARAGEWQEMGGLCPPGDFDGYPTWRLPCAPPVRCPALRLFPRKPGGVVNVLLVL